MKHAKPSKSAKKTPGAALHSNKPVAWVLVLFVFFLPLIFNPFGYNMFAAVRAAFLYVVAAAIILLFLARSLSEGELRIRKSPLDIPIAAFVLGLIASTLTSVHLSTSIFGRIWRYEGLLAWLSYFAVYFAAVQTSGEKKQQVRLLYGVIGSSLIISLYGVLQHFKIDFIPWSPDQDLTRSISTLGGPTYLGAYLALILPLAIVTALSRRFPPRLRVLSSASTVLISLALLFTFARAAWVAVLVSVLFLLVLNLRGIVRNKVALLSVVALILLVFLLFASGRLNPYVERAKSAFNLTRGSSGGIRLLTWQQTIEMTKNRPWLGWGPETFALVFPRYITVEWEQIVRRDLPTDKAHNDLLQVASTMGLASVVPYVLIYILFLWHCLRSIKYLDDPFQKNLIKGLSAGILAYLVQLQFNFSVVDVTPIFWVFMGMAMSLSASARGKREWVSPPFKALSPYGLRFVLAAGGLLVLGVLILAGRPVLADTHLRRGLEALQRNDGEEAVNELSLARSLDFKEPYYSQMLGQVYIKLLNAAGDKSYFYKALEVLGEGQEVNLLDEYTYLYMGDAYLAGAEVLGEPSLLRLAAKNYRKVLANDPNFAKVHLSLGIVYAQMNMLAKAINEWKIVPNLYPASDTAYYNLGVAYEKMGKKVDALQNFKKALELSPSNQAARQAINQLQK